MKHIMVSIFRQVSQDLEKKFHKLNIYVEDTFISQSRTVQTFEDEVIKDQPPVVHPDTFCYFQNFCLVVLLIFFSVQCN